jgi:hypothetical protein
VKIVKSKEEILKEISFNETILIHEHIRFLDLQGKYFWPFVLSPNPDSEIGSEGASLLALALQNNTTLTTLYLGSKYLFVTLPIQGNEIGSKGASAFALALQNNKTLLTFVFRSNYFFHLSFLYY